MGKGRLDKSEVIREILDALRIEDSKLARPPNWVTTSQLRNSAKANWTLEELGWKRHQAGDYDEWDGLTGWFVEFVDTHKELLQQHSYLKTWYRAASVCVES